MECVCKIAQKVMNDAHLSKTLSKSMSRLFEESVFKQNKKQEVFNSLRKNVYSAVV